MTTTTVTITEAVEAFAQELADAVNTGEFSDELRAKVERILGWNAEKAVNILEVFADRFNKAAQAIADSR